MSDIESPHRRERVQLARTGSYGTTGGARSNVSALELAQGEPIEARAAEHSHIPKYIVGDGAPDTPSAYGATPNAFDTENGGDFDGDLVPEDSGSANEASALVHSRKVEPKRGWCTPERGDLQRWPFIGYAVLAGCLFGFLWSIKETGWTIEDPAKNPLIGPSVEALVSSGAKLTPLMWKYGQWWRLVTQLFLHGGVIHLVMNMYVLFRHGFPLERHAGSARFGAIYASAGILASVASAVFIPDIISVGASGAIFGILGAIWGDFLTNYRLMLQSKGGCTACVLTLLSLGLSTLINLAIGLLPFVDNFAHVGGFVGGITIGVVVMVRPRKEGIPDSVRVCQFTGICIYITLLFFGFLSLFLKWDVPGWCPLCRALTCVPTPLWDCGYEDELPENKNRRLEWIPESEWLTI